MIKKKVLITGITGQVGSYLAESLLKNNYEVHGMVRRTSSYIRQRIDHLTSDPNIKDKTLFLHYGDLTDGSNISRLIEKIQPDCVVNLGAQSVHPETLINIRRNAGTEISTEVIEIQDLWSNKRNRFREIKKEICKTEGDPIEVEVIDCPLNKQLKVLGYLGGMGQWFPIKQISRHWYKGKLIKLRQKWGEVLVTPNHSVYNMFGKLVRPTENPELLAMRKINHHESSPRKQINLKTNDKNIETKDGWTWHLDQKQAKVRTELTLEDGSLQAFLKFCGAYISEGWVCFNKANGNYLVNISQNNKQWLKDLIKEIDKFYSGPICIVEHKKKNYDSTYEINISCKLLYKIMKKYCGRYSINKKIPRFLFNLPKEEWENLLKTLFEGDGSITNYMTCTNKRYSSTSRKLIAQLCLIWTMLGIDYNYSHYVFNNENWNDKYELRQVHSYQRNQGNLDYEEIEYEGYVYDISVDEVHNFCAGLGNIVVHNSHVKISFDVPEYSAQVDGVGVLRLLDAIREVCPQTKLVHASTSEMFGKVQETPQKETTPFYPRSPYAAAKIFAYWIIRNYREAYNIFASNIIMFNNESPRRGENFVTKKISMAAANIAKGKQQKVSLGNLSALRDWGYTPDYCSAIVMIMEHHEPLDLIIATGENHSVEEFCSLAFEYAGMPLEFSGEGIDRKGYDRNGIVRVDVNPKYFRPTEVETLLGDASKAKEILGWEPTTKFRDIVRIMVEHDLRNS